MNEQNLNELDIGKRIKVTLKNGFAYRGEVMGFALKDRFLIFKDDRSGLIYISISDISLIHKLEERNE